MDGESSAPACGIMDRSKVMLATTAIAAQLYMAHVSGGFYCTNTARFSLSTYLSLYGGTQLVSYVPVLGERREIIRVPHQKQGSWPIRPRWAGTDSSTCSKNRERWGAAGPSCPRRVAPRGIASLPNRTTRTLKSNVEDDVRCSAFEPWPTEIGLLPATATAQS